MNSFHDIRFPLSVSFGATGGPERHNEIVLLTSGREKRNARMAHSRRHYDAGTGVRSLKDLYEVMAFFEARRGSLTAFRFRDPFDMKSCRPEADPSPLDQLIGTGDGATVTFSLVKWYGAGAEAAARPVTKPVAGTVRVAVDGAELAGEGFAVDCLTGEVALAAAPAAGAAVTAGFSFDVPVRFDCERLSASLVKFGAGQIPSIPLVEVFE